MVVVLEKIYLVFKFVLSKAKFFPFFVGGRKICKYIIYFFVAFLVVPTEFSAQADGRVVYSRSSPAVVLVVYTNGKEWNYGSGSIIRKDGVVITNYHVVENLRKRGDGTLIVYRRPDKLTGESRNDLQHAFSADILVYSEELDLALLKMFDMSSGQAPLDLPALTMSTERLVSVGSRVYALGHPKRGSFWTQTSGEISGISLNHEGMANYDIYQHSAPINPGNSGGPLVDSEGLQVGVNTFVRRGGGDETVLEGLGFAISAKTVKNWLDNAIGQNFLDKPDKNDTPDKPETGKKRPESFDDFLSRIRNSSTSQTNYDSGSQDEVTNKDSIDGLENSSVVQTFEEFYERLTR